MRSATRFAAQFASSIKTLLHQISPSNQMLGLVFLQRLQPRRYQLQFGVVHWLRTLSPILILCVALSVTAQDAPLRPSSQELFQAGVSSMKKADTAQTPDEIVENLKIAIQQFREAVELRPDNCLAQSLLAHTTGVLARNLTNQEERVTCALQAKERFATAAQCESTDWRLFNEWGAFLLFHAQRLASNPAEAHADHVEALQHLEKAHELAALRTDQAQVENTIAQCLVGEATIATEPEQRRDFYRKAIDQFELAYGKSSVMFDAPSYSAWGEALIGLSQLTDDSQLLYRAVERLRSAVDKDPKELTARFRLARAHAMLGQNESAMDQLRFCSQLDEQRTAVWASNEPALAALRENADFQEIINKKPADKSAEAVFKAGIDLQNAAEKAKSPAEALANFQRAIEQYQKAVALKPDHYPSQFMWAHCLHMLTQMVKDPKEKQQLARSANQRFQAAAPLAETDWKFYYDWAVLLAGQTDSFATNAAESLAVYEAARKLFEKSLELARFSGDKATIQRDFALCRIKLAEGSNDTNLKRKLYNQAIDDFDFASQTSPKTMTARYYGLWGVALVQIAKLDGNRMMLRKATERLLTALDMEPANNEIRYNLVCAYALLDQPEQAMRHLQLCLDNDPQRVIYNAAAKDPDLNALRRTAEYNQMFPSRSTNLTGFTNEPQISDR